MLQDRGKHSEAWFRPEFLISEKKKKILREIFYYWDGKAYNELATSLMPAEAKEARAAGVFTAGNQVANDLILDNLKRGDSLGMPIRARLPLVPGYNDSVENIRSTASFVAGLANLEALDILPYHHGRAQMGATGATIRLAWRCAPYQGPGV